MESAQNRGYFAPQGWLLTPGLQVASDRPTGRAHGWLKSAAGRAAGSGLRTRKSLIRLDFIEQKSERSVMLQDTGVGRNGIANALSWLDRIKAGKTYEEIALEDAIPTARVRKAIRYARPHRVARCRSILRS